ncbi:hypothetical protein [Streptomyces sp. RFCAC02]|uniref:hypothetical protein n=1 Tax=Streptomyces sp. RFCAC02 TaxID=2499143 RepID=UPI001F0F9072|nr:hypothetical protein [Streptomyces sp. RFCAC02]
MTHPSTTPPAHAPGGAPPGIPGARTPGREPAAGGTAPPAAVPPRRAAAWREAAARLRRAARTEPGRLRAVGALLAGLLLAFGAVTAYQVQDRSAAADTVRRTSQPLSTIAAEIYRSLADANTTAVNGFLAGDGETAATRTAYRRDIAEAAGALARAASDTSTSAESERYIACLSRGLPVYSGLVEAARANNRQRLPLGGAYLRYADDLMQRGVPTALAADTGAAPDCDADGDGTDDGLLPTAEALYRLETARFRDDLADAGSRPWAALAVGGAAVVVLVWAQRRHYLRTNRVLNPGLLAATATTAVLLLWLAGAQTLSRAAHDDIRQGPALSLPTLNDARIAALKAHGDESLALVARGGSDVFEDSYREAVRELGGADNGLLAQAAGLAGDEARAHITAAADATETWRTRHNLSQAAEREGDYDGAVAFVIGAEESTQEAFHAVDTALGEAVAAEQDRFDAAADRARRSLTGLAAGAGVLGVLGTAAALSGMGRRLSEYR